MYRRRYVQLLGIGGTASVAGCSERASDPTPNQPSVADMTLATATTVEDSGLLGELLSGFQTSFETTVKPLVRGTGAALRTARDGDCDAVLVHARTLKNEFLHAGYGLNRRQVMVNDFMLVGPADDPAGVANGAPPEAFRRIVERDSPFLSRGDQSGTHTRELQIWNEAGVTPSGGWYRGTGQGMGDTLVAAEQASAYTLTDRGTFLNVSSSGPLAIHLAGGLDDPPTLLRNESAVIPVNLARHETAYALAMAFAGHLTGEGQAVIGDFRVNGEQAFRSSGLSSRPRFAQYVPTSWSREEC